MPLTKATFRQNCIQKIKSLSAHNKYYRDAMINRRLMEELKRRKYKSILFYNPLPFEANIIKIIKNKRQKCDIFTPFMQGESFKMVPFRLPLSKKKFGIFEAGDTTRNIKKVDIVIAPVVGVDGEFRRVGFGKGMYDRFFAKLKKRPYIIFIQPTLCYTKEFICDDYDTQGDLLITPTRVLKRK